MTEKEREDKIRNKKAPQFATWLSLTRSFQLSMELACVVLNGCPLGYILSNRLGLTFGMVLLELLISTMLICTSFALFLVRWRRKKHKSAWLVTFIVLDCLCTGMLLSVNIVLSRAGLPDDCSGLTRSNFASGDAPNDPSQGFSTVRFGNGSSKGQLDRFCHFERTIYFVCLGLIFSYLVTIILTVLLLFEKHYTPNSRVEELIASLQRACSSSSSSSEDKAAAIAATSSPLLGSRSSSARLATAQRQRSSTSTSGMSAVATASGARGPLLSSIAAPPSEGVITRTGSLRSTVSASTAAAHRNSDVPTRRLVGGENDGGTAGSGGFHGAPARGGPPSEPTTLPALGGLSRLPFPSMGTSALGISLDRYWEPRNYHRHMLQHHALHPPTEEEEEALAATVSDGMRAPERRQEQEQEQRLLLLAAASPPGMASMAEEDEDEDEERMAQNALVTDGMRGRGRDEATALPPYSPGPAQLAQMAGHGAGESNDMALSGYVKGLTRAQDMKDSGGD